MNLEKFTDRAKGFLQSAQTIAIRMNHQRISPEHLLKALLEDNQGMAWQLIERAGGNPRLAVDEVDAALGESLSTLIFDGDQETLTLTRNAPPALMAAAVAATRA